MAEDRSRAHENRDRAQHDWRIPSHNADPACCSHDRRAGCQRDWPLRHRNGVTRSERGDGVVLPIELAHERVDWRHDGARLGDMLLKQTFVDAYAGDVEGRSGRAWRRLMRSVTVTASTSPLPKFGGNVLRSTMPRSLSRRRAASHAPEVIDRGRAERSRAQAFLGGKAARAGDASTQASRDGQQPCERAAGIFAKAISIGLRSAHRRQVLRANACRLDCDRDFGPLVCCEIVHHHDVARLERRHEDLRHVSLERRPHPWDRRGPSTRSCRSP